MFVAPNFDAVRGDQRLSLGISNHHRLEYTFYMQAWQAQPTGIANSAKSAMIQGNLRESNVEQFNVVLKPVYPVN